MGPTEKIELMKQLFKHALPVSLLFPVLLLMACSDYFMDEQKTMQLAQDYLQSGDIIAAAIELRNTLSENPDNAMARYQLATIYLDFGDYETADKEFRRAQASGWDEAEVVYGRMRAKFGLGDFQGVLRDSVLRDTWPAPMQAVILSTRALANAALDKRDEAFIDLEQAQGLDATSAVVIRTGIQLRLIEGGKEDAVNALQKALLSYPDDPELLLLHAGMVAEHDPAAAEEIYSRVIEFDTGGYISAYGRSARRQLVQLLILEQKIEQADKTLKPLFGRDRKDPFTNYLGGVIAFRQGDYGKANELLLKVLKLAPDHNPTRLMFGTVSYAEKNYEQAAIFSVEISCESP